MILGIFMSLLVFHYSLAPYFLLILLPEVSVSTWYIAFSAINLQTS